MILSAWQRSVIAIFALGICAFAAGGEPPERKVEGNVITSEQNPKVQIELPRKVQYVGSDRWNLLEIADCELHVFVEAGQQQTVRTLYWIQFEGYLPSKPDLKYEYDSQWHTTIGGLDFYVDASIRTKDDRVTPGSDLEHLQKLLKENGYKLPSGMMSVRLVHLLDETKRQELMIIYTEDVASVGFSANDLKKGGQAYEEWKEIQKGLLERAEHKIEISEP
jgi:hypothetical protein